MNWLKKLIGAPAAAAEPVEDENACPRCRYKPLMDVPTDDDRRLARLCGNCGWHSDRNGAAI